MGKRFEPICLQRRYTNGQKAYEKLPNIIRHQGNTNQIHNEIALHNHLGDYYQKIDDNES